MEYKLKAEPAVFAITCFASAKMSHHLFNMARTYGEDGDAWLARTYLYCASIELGLKASILGLDCTVAEKKRMKAIGHDLIVLKDEFEKAHGIVIFDPEDVDAMNRINGYFMRKGIEYFDITVLTSAMQGFSDMPKVEELEAVALKVNAFLASNDFFINGKTSESPPGGIITLV